MIWVCINPTSEVLMWIWSMEVYEWFFVSFCWVLTFYIYIRWYKLWLFTFDYTIKPILIWETKAISAEGEPIPLQEELKTSILNFSSAPTTKSKIIWSRPSIRSKFSALWMKKKRSTIIFNQRLFSKMCSLNNHLNFYFKAKTK